MVELVPWIRLLRYRRRRLLVGGLLMFTTLLAGMGLLALSGWFITATALTGLLLAAGVQAHLNIYAPGGGIRAFALGRTVSRYLEKLYNHDTILRLLSDVRVALFRQLSATRPGHRAHRRPADWLNRLTRDIDILDALYLQLIAPPGLALAGLCLTALILALVAPAMLWSLAPLALLPLVLLMLALVTTRGERDRGYREADLRGRLVDALEGRAELTAAQLWSRESEQLIEATRELDRLRLSSETATAVAQGATLLAVHLAVLIAIVQGLALWQQGSLGGPVVLLIALGILGLGEAFTGLPAAFGRLGATLGAASRLNEQGAPPIHEPTPGKPKPQPVALEQLIVTRNGEPLFTPLTLQLEPGERLAVTGPSGCGKSSLLDCLAGLALPYHGAVLQSGQPFDPATDTCWRSGVSYLEQRTHLFNSSLRWNLLIARPDATDDMLMDVINAVALTELVEMLPNGLDSWIGDQGSKLSGGERRRVALARALLRPGWLLLLDEPFTGVDEATQQKIQLAIEPWLASRTCIMAAHDPAALPVADRHITLGPEPGDPD